MKKIIFAGLMVLTVGVAHGQNRAGWDSEQRYPMPSMTRSGIVINNYNLTNQEALQFNYLLGFRLPRGRYAVDPYGNFGIEGKAPVINLIQLIQHRQRSGQLPSQFGGNGEITSRSWFPGGQDSYYSRGSNGEWGMSVGNCTVINGDVSC